MSFRFRNLAIAMLLMVPMMATTLVMGVNAQDDAQPLKIGALLPFSGDLSDFGPAMYNSVELAVNQINEAGGVNGQPIELAKGDSATAPQQAVEEARRLIEVEGVNAIIGPAGSGTTLQVAESVTGPAGIVEITGSGTSPALTTANDDGYLFRTTISDAAQGVVLAQVAHEEGLTSVCTLYTNNAYGQGLSSSFSAAFEELGGTVTAQVPHEQQQASYSSEISACLDGDPEAMVALSYPESMGVYLREALESGKVSTFLVSDGGRSQELFDQLGAENFEGMMGTSAGAPDTEGGATFESAYEDAYGELPPLPYLKENYDAVYLIALAAQAAGSSDSTAIRDQMLNIANPPGEVVLPGTDGFTQAIELLANGENINYEGASGSVNLDENGDVLTGQINIWTIKDGQIVDVGSRDVDLSAGGEGTPEATPEAA